MNSHKTFILLTLFCLFISPGFTQEDLSQTVSQVSLELIKNLEDDAGAPYRIKRNALLVGARLQASDFEITAKRFPTHSLEGRLLEIWQARLEDPEVFEKIAPYANLVALDPVSQIQVASRKGSSKKPILVLRPLELELLHPRIRQSVKDDEALYLRALELGQAIRQDAEKLIEAGNASFSLLERRHREAIRNLHLAAENSARGRQIFRDVVAAAQPPALGQLAPMPPELDQAYLLAWEELIISVSDLQSKLRLLPFLAQFQSAPSAPCFGLLLKQAIYAMKIDKQDQDAAWMAYAVMDYFRDHPSEQAVHALADAIRFAKSGSNAMDLPLGQRLNSPSWQSVLDTATRTSPESAQLLRSQGSIRRK